MVVCAWVWYVCGVSEMVWLSVHGHRMCVVWEVRVRWCGRMCMGVGDGEGGVSEMVWLCAWAWVR